ncbi:hypothetical protein C8J57DRAFT_606848 [Mycena rebaudengoi]|nr:hypothetical protein C8J57DRAFT_606848 [Mycena rebaudengoi]
MGRRKIEIQPITHERNRSVTFLKRKAGLFKKAHELGVLCSVDVAVIIFEERPGHHHKLYQYCSGDIQDIVARHVQYNGERDTRGPGDFNGSGTKVEEAGDADDDDADEDEAQGRTRTGSTFCRPGIITTQQGTVLLTRRGWAAAGARRGSGRTRSGARAVAGRARRGPSRHARAGAMRMRRR